MHSWNKLRLFTIFLLFCIYEAKGTEPDNPIVSTKYGQLKGKRVEVKETKKAVYAYLTIPFAKPPVGSLRFSPPQPPESWKGVRDAAITFPPICLQDKKQIEILSEQLNINMPSMEMNEDCLYLNVYTPVQPTETANLPVMVFIHGGGLMIGGTFMSDGSPLAAYGNVVVVIIQYRLGIPGFFSTGDEHARGNWGLLDQVAALQWVQENIKNFGGDPGSVTIFGESAGGLSVSMHVLSPLSSGLFHKAISESGTSLIPGLVSNDPQPITKMIANSSGCDTVDSASMVKCLRKKSEEEMLNATYSMQKIAVPVVVDGVFLTKLPEELLPAKEFSGVSYLLGVNNHEAGWTIPSMMLPPGWQEGLDRATVDSFMDNVFMAVSSGEELKQLLTEEYFKDTEDPIKLRDLLLELVGDFVLVIPAIRVANYHRDAGHPVYFYEFQHRPSVYGDKRPEFVKCDHGDELGFVLGMPFLNSDFKLFENATEEEKELSRTVMKYWSSFARTGSPNVKGLLEWPAYDHREEYMELKIKQSIARHFKDNRVTFWTKTLPDKMKKMAEQKSEHSEL